MTYHANHNTCHNSNWDSKAFHGEVMVYFNDTLTKTDILENNEWENIKEIISKPNPDFTNLVQEKLFFNEKNFKECAEMEKKHLSKDLGRDLTREEIKKIEDSYKKDDFDLSYTLNPNIIEWLNENVKDFKNFDGTNVEDINERKGWCIGNDEAISKNDEFTIFFKRELDALKFIREFSIFKEPIFYFDYFSDDRRNMDLNKYIYLYNEYARENNIELIDTSKILLTNYYQGNTNLDTLSFKLLDWEKTDIDEETGEVYRSDDIELTEDELNNFVKFLYKTTNDDIKYENYNLVDYPEHINDLKKTDEISLYYENEVFDSIERE